MKRYEFKVVVHEGRDHFWDELIGKTGCDDVKDLIKDCLSSVGLFEGDNCEITLTQYNEDE